MFKFGQHKPITGEIFICKILIVDRDERRYFRIMSNISHNFGAATIQKRRFTVEVIIGYAERTELFQHIQNIFFVQSPKTGQHQLAAGYVYDFL